MRSTSLKEKNKATRFTDAEHFLSVSFPIIARMNPESINHTVKFVIWVSEIMAVPSAQLDLTILYLHLIIGLVLIFLFKGFEQHVVGPINSCVRFQLPIVL